MIPRRAIVATTAARMALLGAAYAAILITFTTAYRSQIPWVQEVAGWTAGIALVLIYWRGFVEIKSSNSDATRVMVVVAALLSLSVTFTPYFDSSDIENYVNIGWAQSHYGINPYAQLLNRVAGTDRDPMVYPDWTGTFDQYGYLFSRIAWCLSIFGGGHPYRTLILFKLLNFAVFMAIAMMLAAIARRAGLERADLALYLYLWNPIFPLLFGADGHNDLIVGFFMVLAILCAVCGWEVAIIPALVAGYAIKPTPAVVIPFAAMFILRRRGFVAVTISIAIGLAMFAALAMPYLHGAGYSRQIWAVHEILRPVYTLEATLSYLIYRIELLFPGLVVGKRAINVVLVLAMFSIYGLFVAIEFVRWCRGRIESVEALLIVAVLIPTVLIAIVNSRYLPWYLGQYLPLAFLIDRRHWLFQLNIAFSLLALFSYTSVMLVPVLNYLAVLGIPTAWVLWMRWPEVRVSIAGERNPGMGDNVSRETSSSGEKKTN